MSEDYRGPSGPPFWGWETVLALAIVAILGGAIFKALWSNGIQEGRRQMTLETTKVPIEPLHITPMESELRSLPVQDADRIMAEAKQRIDGRKSGVTKYFKNAGIRGNKKRHTTDATIPLLHDKPTDNPAVFSSASSSTENKK
jgi:hypothetical protein